MFCLLRCNLSLLECVCSVACLIYPSKTEEKRFLPDNFFLLQIQKSGIKYVGDVKLLLSF